jgi:hypothetical protein
VPSSTGVVGISSDNLDSVMNIITLFNGTDDRAQWETTLFSPNTAQAKTISTFGTSTDTQAVIDTRSAGQRVANADIDAVRFFPASGTFSGRYRVYGIP